MPSLLSAASHRRDCIDFRNVVKNKIRGKIMNIKWNHKDQKWPQATADLRDYIYIVSDGEEMTIARWVDLCHEDPNCGADPDEFEFLPVKDIEVLYW